MPFSRTSLGRFRMVALAEGISFLVLLFIAMPVKYMLGHPELVKFTGWLHGLLFVAYLILLAQVTTVRRWNTMKVILALIASILPFGTLVLDRQWIKEDQEQKA